ncbi:MAG: hypothetical protein JXJ04_20020 [Spirochaetales bacterium]|nr:hypothetical protein [Spirochaetales bacterium]
MHTIINKEFDRPDPAIIKRYRNLVKNFFSPACLVCDAQKRSNALNHGFRPVGEHKAVGVALTIKFDISDLVDPMPVLRFAQEGDFIVIAANEDMDTAMWGGMTSNLAKKMKLAGVLVDGSTRDIDEIKDLDFPVWVKSSVPRPSPTAIHGRFEPIQVNVPVVVGKVSISPGDIIVADESGVTVVPKSDILAVIEAAEKQAQKELDIRNRILSGSSIQQILDEFGHI